MAFTVVGFVFFVFLVAKENFIRRDSTLLRIRSRSNTKKAAQSHSSKAQSWLSQFLMVTKMPPSVHFPPSEEFTHIRHPQKMRYHTHQLIINKEYRVKDPVLNLCLKYIVIFKFLHMVSSTCAFKSMLPPNVRDSFKCIRVERAKVCCLNSRHSTHLVTSDRLLSLLVISLWY